MATASTSPLSDVRVMIEVMIELMALKATVSFKQDLLPKSMTVFWAGDLELMYLTTRFTNMAEIEVKDQVMTTNQHDWSKFHTMSVDFVLLDL